METDKSSDFVVALVIYAMRCVEDGDAAALARMGFGPAEVEELAALRVADIGRIVKQGAELVDVKVDRRAFSDMVRRIRAEGLAADWEQTLIRADAPFEMMARLFGTSERDYRKWRQLYAVSSTGRTPEPSEEEETRLWRVLAKRMQSARRKVLSPAEYLAVSRECGASLRTVWQQSKRVANGSG